MINRVNHISGSPKSIYFGVNKVAIYLIISLILIVGTIFTLLVIEEGSNIGGVAIAILSITSVLLFFFKQKNTNHKINIKGIKIDNIFYEWELIKDLHILRKQLKKKTGTYFIVFDYQNKNQKIKINTTIRSIDEINNILYTYNKYWNDNKTHNTEYCK
jgi:hypothetical protein